MLTTLYGDKRIDLLVGAMYDMALSNGSGFAYMVFDYCSIKG